MAKYSNRSRCRKLELYDDEMSSITTNKYLTKSRKTVYETNNYNLISEQSSNPISTPLAENQIIIDSDNEMTNNIHTEYNNNTFTASNNNSIISDAEEEDDDFDLFDGQSVDDESISLEAIIFEMLYEGAELSVFDASILLISFFHRFRLSKLAQTELLNLIRFMLPLINKLPKTLNKLFRAVSMNPINIIEKKYCNICSNQLNNQDICVNTMCSKNNTIIQKYNLLSFVNIYQQIERFLNKNMPMILEYVNKERKFVDLIDGDRYKNIKEKNTLNFMIYSDGIKLADSSLSDYWPIFLSIVELPRSLRDSIRNKIIFGIYSGRKKPTSDILFKILIEQIEELNKTGFDVLVEKQIFHIKLGYYGVLGDTPAKAIFTNMIQFNGFNGCMYCLNPGIRNK